MIKFLVGFLCGAAVMLIILAAIYNVVSIGLSTGAVFPSIWEVVRAWFEGLQI